MYRERGRLPARIPITMVPPLAPQDIVAATVDDIPVVAALAEVIWREHYPAIISHAQIDYMLARGYSAEALGAFVHDEGAGLAILVVGGSPAGFAAWCRADEPATTKLDKLYVLASARGTGGGRRLIEHVETAARADRSGALILNVNKHNAKAIAAYRACGFAIRDEVVADIGGGFVMDDFVMAKAL